MKVLYFSRLNLEGNFKLLWDPEVKDFFFPVFGLMWDFGIDPKGLSQVECYPVCPLNKYLT